jgi:hypothetical protein
MQPPDSVQSPLTHCPPGLHVSFCGQSLGTLQLLPEIWLPPCPLPLLEKMGHPARTLASRPPKPSRESLFIPSPESTGSRRKTCAGNPTQQRVASAVPSTNNTTNPRFQKMRPPAVKPGSRRRVAEAPHLLVPVSPKVAQKTRGCRGRAPLGRLRAPCDGVRNRLARERNTARPPGIRPGLDNPCYRPTPRMALGTRRARLLGVC